MARVYEDFPGGWVVVAAKNLRIACCDCGLTHVIQIRKKNGQFELKLDRDNRSTALLRRHNEHDCKPRQPRRSRKAS